MKILKNHNFALSDITLEDKVNKMAIKEVQNNILYWDGDEYKPQNKPIQSLMIHDAEMDEKAISEKCQHFFHQIPNKIEKTDL